MEKKEHEMEQGLHEAERREHEMEQRLHEAERREHEMEQRLHEAERREREVEQRLHEAGVKEPEQESRPAKKPKKLSGSMAAKTAVFILFLSGILVGLASLCLCIYMDENSFYTSNQKYALSEAMCANGMEAIFAVRDYIDNGNLEAAKAYCEGRNVDVELWSGITENEESKLLWSSNENLDKTSCAQIESCVRFSSLEQTVLLNYHVLKTKQDYIMNAYIDLSFPMDDELKGLGEGLLFLYEARYQIIVLCGAALLISLICFIFLLCAAGHRNDREGIADGVLTGFHLEVLTVIFGGVGGAILLAVRNVANSRNYPLVLTIGGTLLTVCLTFYFMDVAIRFKQGNVLKHTLVYVVFRGIGKCLVWIVTGLPAVLTTMILFLAVCILEFLGGCYLTSSAEWFLPWALEKMLLFLVILYAAGTCKKLLKASRALAEGQENYRVDTSKMFGEFKEHGENLNSMGEGIRKAVSERMKSEHLKTELITNVSHDIKTPLTSIINYADLICEEKSENEKINEYAEVLLRQSRRLKKLLEDLMEASKATTGNLEVDPQPCEVGVLLTQAVGEYQKKLEEKDLELIVRQPEDAVKIMADGRHLWRVFDNLLNNICKYAQENSRVYLSVEVREEKAVIIFRNMSKYVLDVSPEELEERFVRGDKSRRMEGNGLGLSIAKSLVELQNGNMEIVTDGDLFKVTLCFERI